ncbi:hypothetical protein [Pseudonocardia adelaidensis]|uniref:Uncharacterized protein n=1 Tax=Pseudonocardia adelaidensis TaxID=648754 RepID=A0ABP9PCP0_9PSEU
MQFLYREDCGHQGQTDRPDLFNARPVQRGRLGTGRAMLPRLRGPARLYIGLAYPVLAAQLAILEELRGDVTELDRRVRACNAPTWLTSGSLEQYHGPLTCGIVGGFG